MTNQRERLKKTRENRRKRHRRLIEAAIRDGDPAAAALRAWDLFRAEQAACPNQDAVNRIAREVTRHLIDKSAEFPGGDS